MKSRSQAESFGEASMKNLGSVNRPYVGFEDWFLYVLVVWSE